MYSLLKKMFTRSCSFCLSLFLLCVRNALEPQGNIIKIMTTRGPTVCLAELGEESIQKQLCSCPHKKMYCSDNTILQNFIQNPWPPLLLQSLK